jgi:DNA integrity scanning protein DisA with diadenylate cyclase activity
MANDVFLGLIALGVLVMAAIQVGAVVLALRAARRLEGAVTVLQQDLKPILANLQTMTTEAARATATAAAQVDRLEKMVGEVVRRVDTAATTVHETIVVPARELMAVVQGIKTVFTAFRGEPGDARRRRPAAAEDEDPLFIG